MNNLVFTILISIFSFSTLAQTYIGENSSGRECKLTVVSRSEAGIKVEWKGINEGSTPSEQLDNPISGKFELKKINDGFYQYRKYSIPIMDIALFQTDFDFSERDEKLYFSYSKQNSITGRYDRLVCNLKN